MTAPRRLGLLGGSFDPPHFGHLFGALYAVECGAVDRVLLIPAARHPWGKNFTAPFADRCRMIGLAIERYPHLEVCDIESRRDGPSYTVDTVLALRALHPEAEMRLLLGSDTLADFPNWRSAETIAREAPPLELPRFDPERGHSLAGALPIASSTAVRAALAEGRKEVAARLVPAAVLDYIDAHGLYR